MSIKANKQKLLYLLSRFHLQNGAIRRCYPGSNIVEPPHHVPDKNCQKPLRAWKWWSLRSPLESDRLDHGRWDERLARGQVLGCPVEPVFRMLFAQLLMQLRDAVAEFTLTEQPDNLVVACIPSKQQVTNIKPECNANECKLKTYLTAFNLTEMHLTHEIV